MTQADVDLSRVLAEIEEDARRKRATGELPPSLERELDLAFDRYAPVGTLDNDFGEALKAADRASFANVAVPTASNKPGVSLVKRVLRKVMAWYLNYLAQQVTAFGSATVRALRALGARVDDLEETVSGLGAVADDGSDRPAEDADLSPWAELAVARMSSVGGRVLHAECGRGSLIGPLRAAGVDAYGVDPRPALVDAAVAAGHDAFPDEVVAHLEAAAEGSLGGLVLSGCVDRLPLPQQRRLVELAANRLASGGVVIVIGTSPDSWRRTTAELEADLAPGRPLHASTWAHLLERQGFAGAEVHQGEAADGLAPVPEGSPASEVLNANIERLNGALFGPRSFAVVATRGS